MLKKLRIYESLYIFLRYKQDIKFIMELFTDFDFRDKKQNEWIPKDQALYVTLYNSILMNVCSYIEEYNRNFFANAEDEFKDRILTIKKIAKPAMKEISKWKDLKDYRNHMIAHNFRIDGREFSFNALGRYNAPRTYRDLALIRKHLMMVHGVIEAEFSDEMPNINPFIKSFEVQEQVINYDDVEVDLNKVLNEINQICLANKKPYRLDVAHFMDL